MVPYKSGLNIHQLEINAVNFDLVVIFALELT